MKRIKKQLLIILILFIISISITLYAVSNLPLATSPKHSDIEASKWKLDLENRLNRLEKDLTKHNENIKLILDQATQTTQKQFDVEEDQCPTIPNELIQKVDVQMLKLYEEVLKFDNLDGGVWKQGFKITYNEQDWNKYHKLKVFIVPHSHNDPGWIKTVDEYYLAQTKHILDNMLNKLKDDPNKKFIWAEISYLSMWYRTLDIEKQSILKRLLKENQLEIVTGGWVMTDEANSHFQSILIELIEGHQWLLENLNYVPKNSWSIDPFGLSPTLAYLLKRSGFDNLLIQRVHYNVKKHLASLKQLEFKWRQLWDEKGNSDLFTHMMPFYSYDVPHTCGPNPNVCCQFDFKRLPGFGVTCPWGISPQPITKNNVAEKAHMLLDQYRQKSQLFRTNVLLVPLGDDFRYDQSREWDAQFNNYQMINDFINENDHFNTQIQFGTLNDYFEAVHEEKTLEMFPTLSGDFFTYADRDDHYWSGYYTSRPFYKRQDRVLLYYIRSVDILYTLCLNHIRNDHYRKQLHNENDVARLLEYARQSLSLFQHHDGITGTARDHVVIDYGKRMFNSIRNCQKVIEYLTYILSNSIHSTISPSPPKLPNINDSNSYYDIDDLRISHDSLSTKLTISLGDVLPKKQLVFYNSLTIHRNEIVTVLVSTPQVQVKNEMDEMIDCQISPLFEYDSEISNDKYQLSFEVNIKPLALVTYQLEYIKNINHSKIHIAKITMLNTQSKYINLDAMPDCFKPMISTMQQSRDFQLTNAHVQISFNQYAHLKAIKLVEANQLHSVHLEFVKYGVRHFLRYGHKGSNNMPPGAEERSGAYLFLPDGEATPLVKQLISTIKIVQGSLVSSMQVQLPYLNHKVTLYNSRGGADSLGLEIENIVDVKDVKNMEISMRLSTDIKNSQQFFTDLNAFQMIERKTLKKLPIQGNYYPLPSQAYIEDDNVRLTLLTSTPLGVASLNEGQLEVMQDRRLDQDDNRGLGQGVQDNHPTRHIFRVLLENSKQQHCNRNLEGVGFMTQRAHLSSETLLNPLMTLVANDDNQKLSSDKKLTAEFLNEQLHFDISLVLFRNGLVIRNSDSKQNNHNNGLILQRHQFSQCYYRSNSFDGFVNLTNFLPKNVRKADIFKSNLTFLKLESNTPINPNNLFKLCQMHLQAFVIHY